MNARRSPARRLIPLVLMTTLAVAIGGVASAAPGDVDMSFGDAGAKTVSIGASTDVGGIVRRADGTFVIGASDGVYVATVALKQNGQPLSGYGTGGVSTVPVPGSQDVTVSDVAVRDDRRVVVAGYDNAVSGTDAFVVARFRPGGEADGSFSDDGVTRIKFPQGDAYGYGIALLPEGKIVVVGEVDPRSGVSNLAIVRLNADGSLDHSFADHGRRVLKVKDGVKGYDGVWRVVAQGHGKVAAVGWSARKNGDYKTLAIRLKPSGVLDRSFGGDGTVIIDADGSDNWAYGLAKDGDKLVLGLHVASSQAAFLRLTSDGRRDRTFGGDGVASHALSVPWEVEAVVVRPDHLVVGVNGFSGDPNVVRLKAGGKLDAGFGMGGEGFGPLSAVSGEDIILGSNGKIVVAGENAGDAFAARFLGP